MRDCARSLLLTAACFAAQPLCASLLPPAVQAALQRSGLPLQSFGLYAQSVEDPTATPLVELNAEHAYTLASTAKLVTSLAALELLGRQHRWRTNAHALGPLHDGTLAGDLLITGGPGGLTEAELSDWFRRMRAQGLREVRGNIVVEGVTLLHERDAPLLSAAPDRWRVPDPRTYTRTALVVIVRPGAQGQALVTLAPHPAGVVVASDVLMRARCSVWARWAPGSASRLLVSGQWASHCGRQEVAFVRPPARSGAAPAAANTTPERVAQLWREAGGHLRGGVVVRERMGPRAAVRVWSQHQSAPLPQLIRAINKTSNNVAARSLLLALAPSMSRRPPVLSAAQARVHGWLRDKGLADGDIRIDWGSGQSRAERGKPRAMVQLLRGAWRADGASAFLDSLPIAGVDGTLAHRMRRGLATGQAYLKTGTLSDTRALAGYVRARSGTVYAVAAMANHPNAARATPALDAFIEWLAAHG